LGIKVQQIFWRDWARDIVRFLPLRNILLFLLCIILGFPIQVPDDLLKGAIAAAKAALEEMDAD
jgi:hypothetical protein